MYAPTISCTPVDRCGNCPCGQELKSLVQSLKASLNRQRLSGIPGQGIASSITSPLDASSATQQCSIVMAELVAAREHVHALEKELTKISNPAQHTELESKLAIESQDSKSDGETVDSDSTYYPVSALSKHCSLMLIPSSAVLLWATPYSNRPPIPK
jgi:hypothetical protein